MIAALVFAATIGVGMEYRDGGGTVDAEPFVYPNAGITIEDEPYYVEGNSPIPILLPDLIGSAFFFLFAGEERIPLSDALNGKREPVAVRVMDGAARWAIPLADVAAIELGATSGFSIGSVFADGERIGVHPVRAGGSLAFRTGTAETVVVRFALEGGNAWTHHASSNPWIGATFRSSMSFGETLVFELRGDYTRTRIDLRTYRTSAGVQVAGVETLHVWGAEARVGFRL